MAAREATGSGIRDDGPGLVDGYRRAVPESVRRAVAARVTPGVRKRVKSGLAEVDAARRMVGEARSRRGLARHQDLLHAPGRTVVRTEAATRLALVVPRPRPLEARRDNLAAVAEALDEAGIDHFAVPGRGDRHSVIGVPAGERGRALRALADLCRRLPGYVGTVPDGRTEPRVVLPGFEPASWPRLGTAPVIRMIWYRTDSARRLVLGSRYGCDVEFWQRRGGELVAPRRNLGAERVRVAGRPVFAAESQFTALAPAWRPDGHPVRTRPEFTGRRPGAVTFPIDAVYTWVDGQDPAWLRRRAETAEPGRAYHPEAANAARYTSRDELRYSLRSLAMYAPWVRHVYLVTDAQVPGWLAESHPGLTVVDHREIFEDPSCLPTFNSHAIESRLHRIPGLSEQFLYFNDDMLLGREAVPQDFFHANGLSKFFTSPALVPQGAARPDDAPVAAAAKNNRTLLEKRFGTVLVQKMKHVPYPLRRSVLAELEAEFPEQHRETSGHRFRSLDDLSIASSLHHYYAYQTGRAVPGNVSYGYYDLADPRTPDRLAQLLARRHQLAFCLNDTVTGEVDSERLEAMVRDFLAAYFPVPGPYERDGGTAAGSAGGAR